MDRKYSTIDLFAGCGGLMDGFMQEGSYNTLACVEWEIFPCQTLVNRLEKKWHHKNAKEEVIRFDIQRTDELIKGFDDVEYGKHIGLDKLIGEKKVDVVIGGPPCQAYSLAGRIRDPHGMRDDYRNYRRMGKSPWISPPCHLTKYLSATEHEEGKVIDPMHLRS